MKVLYPGRRADVMPRIRAPPPPNITDIVALHTTTPCLKFQVRAYVTYASYAVAWLSALQRMRFTFVVVPRSRQHCGPCACPIPALACLTTVVTVYPTPYPTPRLTLALLRFDSPYHTADLQQQHTMPLPSHLFPSCCHFPLPGTPLHSLPLPTTCSSPSHCIYSLPRTFTYLPCW